MFGGTSSKSPSQGTRSKSGSRNAPTWDVPIFFGLMFALSIAELVFTIDSFQFKQKTKTWGSQSGPKTERARLAFLIFSSVRTIMLSAVYCGFHCARKYFHSMFHTIFLVLSTIFWIISGVLIHQMWGTIICNQGVGSIKGGLQDGLTECHELKIIEIIAWVLAGISVIATVPVVMNSIKRRKANHELKKSQV